MNPPVLLDDYWNVEETATALRVARRTLERWKRLRKGPPHIRLGAKTYYKKESVLRWMDSLQVESKSK